MDAKIKFLISRENKINFLDSVEQFMKSCRSEKWESDADNKNHDILYEFGFMSMYGFISIHLKQTLSEYSLN